MLCRRSRGIATHFAGHDLENAVLFFSSYCLVTPRPAQEHTSVRRKQLVAASTIDMLLAAGVKTLFCEKPIKLEHDPHRRQRESPASVPSSAWRHEETELFLLGDDGGSAAGEVVRGKNRGPITRRRALDDHSLRQEGFEIQNPSSCRRSWSSNPRRRVLAPPSVPRTTSPAALLSPLP